MSKLLDEIYFHLLNLPAQRRECGIPFNSLQQPFPSEFNLYGREKIEVACRQDFDHRFIILHSSVFPFKRKHLKIPFNEELTAEIIYCSLKKLELTNIKRKTFHKQPLLLSFGQAYSLTRLFPFLSVTLTVFNRIIENDKRFSFGGQYFMLNCGYCSSFSPDYLICNPEKDLRQQRHKQHQQLQLRQQHQLLSSWGPYKSPVVVPSSYFASSSVADYTAASLLQPPGNASAGGYDNMQQHEQNVESLLLTETSVSLLDGEDDLFLDDHEETSSVDKKSEVSCDVVKKEATPSVPSACVPFAKLMSHPVSPSEFEKTSETSSAVISFSPDFSHGSSNFMIFNSPDMTHASSLSRLITSMQSAEMSGDANSSNKKTIIFLRNPKELDSLMKNRKLTSSYNVSLFVTANRVAEYQAKYQTEATENELCEDWQDLSPSWCPSFLSSSSCSTNNITVNSVHPILFSWSSFVASPASLLSLLSINKNDDISYPVLSYLSAYHRKEKEFPSSCSEFLHDFCTAFPNQHHRLTYLMQLFMTEDASALNGRDLSLLEHAMCSSSVTSVHDKKLIVILLDDPFLSNVDLDGVFHLLLSWLITSSCTDTRAMTLVFDDIDWRNSQLLSALQEILMGRFCHVVLSQSLLSFNSSSVYEVSWVDLLDVVFINGKLSKSALNHISRLLSFGANDRELRDLNRLNNEGVRGCVFCPLRDEACGLFKVTGTPEVALVAEQFHLLEWL
jgi:hypothetical protein